MGCRCNCPNYRTHLSGIRIGGFPHPTTIADRKLSKDMDAFKRLKDDGLVPANVDRAYVMERSATDKREIEMGRPLDKQTLSVLDEAGM